MSERASERVSVFMRTKNKMDLKTNRVYHIFQSVIIRC